jgi:hypothetical protein
MRITPTDPIQSEQTVKLSCNAVKPSFGLLKNGNPPMDPRFLKESPRSTARLKRDLQPCQNPAVRGFSVCRMHGAGGRPTGMRKMAFLDGIQKFECDASEGHNAE